MVASATAALTAVFGVVVFVAGQAIQRFVLEPVQDQRKVIGEIAHAVVMYGNVANVANIRAQNLQIAWSTEPDQVVQHLRELAARLQATLYVIPAYRILAQLHVVPHRKRVLEAIRWLTGWSNSIYSGGATQARDEVARSLGLIRND